MRQRLAGLTILEVMVALTLFSVGALGLAAATAAITRQMTSSLLRSRAGNIARGRNEAGHAEGCTGTSAGTETREGIRSIWRISQGRAETLDQDIEHGTRAGVHADQFLSAIPCD